VVVFLHVTIVFFCKSLFHLQAS